MAMQQHALSNAALGEYMGFVHENKATVFTYEHGYVKLTCPDSAQWKWDTHMYADIATMLPPVQGVALQLDQASIDGMDDMAAFGCKICGNTHELGINEQGICFGCNYEGDSNPLDTSSAADETSINN